MGCYLNHREKQPSQCSQLKIVTSQDIDLPYRHYIKRGVYIPSALPHGQINFIKGCRFVKLQDLCKFFKLISQGKALYSRGGFKKN
ncbi:hypothetical protein pb186bvf_011826 [Paramecium bursaria]